MPTEQEIGYLCNNGFMTERFSEQVDDLVRTFTSKGISEIKEILKDPAYKKIFIKMLYEETANMSQEDKAGVIYEIGKMLKNEQKRID